MASKIKRSGVYRIVNKINGRIYIGSANDMQQRIHAHKSMLRRGTHGNPYLASAWQKYGPDAFTFEEILMCDRFVLIWREQQFLDAYVAHDIPLYNLRVKAESQVGYKFTDAARAKLSAMRKGRLVTPETRLKIGMAHKGKIISPEHRQRISAALTGRSYSLERRTFQSARQKGRPGRPHSPEAKLKMSLAKKGIPLSLECRAKMSRARKGVPKPWLRGRKASPETRAKLKLIRNMPEAIEANRLLHIGRRYSEETRARMSEAHKGIPRSLETRQKISDAQKGIPRPPHTAQWREQMSMLKTGKPWSPARRHAYQQSKLKEMYT